MSAKSSDRREKSGKNKTLSSSSTMSAQEDLLLATRYQILMEDHESLKLDHASLEQRLKDLEDLNAINQRLLTDERERNEKEEATISELMIRNDELLTALEGQEEEHRKQESKYEELAERFEEIEKECLSLKSLYDGKKLNGRGEDNNVVGLEDDVSVAGENHNVNNNTVWPDAILISDSSDAETDNPTTESNRNTPLRVVVKQEEEGDSNGVNSSSQVKHPSSSKVKLPSWSSSSSSSSEDVYLVPLTRSWGDDCNKTS